MQSGCLALTLNFDEMKSARRQFRHVDFRGVVVHTGDMTANRPNGTAPLFLAVDREEVIGYAGKYLRGEAVRLRSSDEGVQVGTATPAGMPLRAICTATPAGMCCLRNGSRCRVDDLIYV